MPKTVDEFEAVLIAFRDNADKLKKEFNIDGDIIPLACIVNGGNEDCRVLCNGFGEGVLCNGFGEGYGDPDDWRHIVITDDKQVICAATTEGWRKGVEWLHKLYTENLFDPDPTPSRRSGALMSPRASPAATVSASPGTWPILSA